MRNLLRHSIRLPRNLIVLLITGYQHTLSPDHGPLRKLYPYGYCRHSPTCSEYAKNVILKRGILPGIPLSLWRILRCNPFTKPDAQAIMRASHRDSTV